MISTAPTSQHTPSPCFLALRPLSLATARWMWWLWSAAAAPRHASLLGAPSRCRCRRRGPRASRAASQHACLYGGLVVRRPAVRRALMWRAGRRWCAQRRGSRSCRGFSRLLAAAMVMMPVAPRLATAAASGRWRWQRRPLRGGLRQRSRWASECGGRPRQRRVAAAATGGKPQALADPRVPGRPAAASRRLGSPRAACWRTSGAVCRRIPWLLKRQQRRRGRLRARRRRWRGSHSRARPQGLGPAARLLPAARAPGPAARGPACPGAVIWRLGVGILLRQPLGGGDPARNWWPDSGPAAALDSSREAQRDQAACKHLSTHCLRIETSRSALRRTRCSSDAR